MGKRVKRGKRTDLKLNVEQLEILSSPARVDLYEALRLRKRATAVELAEDLKKSVHSMYYHLKLLTTVELIRVFEYRRVGKRDEAIFETVSDRLVFNKESTNPAYAEGLIKTVRQALRKAEREHRDARREQFPSESFAILRLQAQLSPENATILRKKLKDLGSWVRKRDLSSATSDSEQISLTGLIVPLVPSER